MITDERKLELEILGKELSEIQEDAYVHYNDQLDEEKVMKLLTDGLYAFEEQMWDETIDWMWEVRQEYINDFKKENNLNDDEIDYIINDLDCRPQINVPVRELLAHSDEIRITMAMYSDHDCINSFYEYEQPVSYKESYIGDCIDFLQINPKEFKAILKSHDIETVGQWPNKKRNPIIHPEEFYEELRESCAASLLSFAVKIRPEDLYDALVEDAKNGGDGKVKRIKINPGTAFGFYSSCYGAGSPFDHKTKESIEIDLTSKNDPSIGFDFGYYSIDECFGTESSFYNELYLY